jgi:hypothetical protein
VDPAEVRALFELQFQACEALYDFAKARRPYAPAEGDHYAHLMFRTYVRASKSYQGAYKLAFDGYGAQSYSLGRSVYEDMLVAHWVTLNPQSAPGQFARHERLMRARFRGYYLRHGLPFDEERYPQIPRAELKQLRQEWRGKHHWTKKSMDELYAEVRHLFPERGNHRRLLDQVDAILHTGSNLIAHHSYLSLDAAVPELPEGRTLADVGASPMLIGQALFIGFFAYFNVVTLLLDTEAHESAESLWCSRIPAFTVVRADGPLET